MERAVSPMSLEVRPKWMNLLEGPTNSATDVKKAITS